jgi:hypothetical protein
VGSEGIINTNAVDRSPHRAHRSDKPSEAPWQEQNLLARRAPSHPQKKWHFLALFGTFRGAARRRSLCAETTWAKSASSSVPFFGTDRLFTKIEPSQPGTTGVTRVVLATKNCVTREGIWHSALNNPETPERCTRTRSLRSAPPRRSRYRSHLTKSGEVDHRQKEMEPVSGLLARPEGKWVCRHGLIIGRGAHQLSI